MTKNNELEKSDIVIDGDMEVDCDIGQEILFYMETWFDVDKKFYICTAADDSTWLNMYGRYNPYRDSLRIECEISSDKSVDQFDYEPTESESRLIKDMVSAKLMEKYRQTPKEYCDSFAKEESLEGGEGNKEEGNHSSLCL